MEKEDLKRLPHMVFSDEKGRIYDHPYFRMVGFSGSKAVTPREKDLIVVPEFSKFFYIPDCPPMGLDPVTGEYRIVNEAEVDGLKIKCFAVSVFLEPGFVRVYLPAVDYRPKAYTLPMWAYTAVGFKDEGYVAAGFQVEYNYRWDARNYDDRELLPAIREFLKDHAKGPLLSHLINCATVNHCFAAKNLFLKRWEAPVPVSQGCNSACLGCLSLQPDESCEPSHQRISFRPSTEEMVPLAIGHLNRGEGAIISFGQGCEGEPLTEYRLIADTIRNIRKQTKEGTINLNTNGSWPGRVRHIIKSGLDSIRISVNSARPEFYRAYYNPVNYDFNDVIDTIAMCRDMGLYTMVNYLVFPGITDQMDEVEALKKLIQKTGINFLHFKNLNIDPQLYMEKMPESTSRAMGMKEMVDLLRNEFPSLEIGYFNQPVR